MLNAKGISTAPHPIMLIIPLLNDFLARPFIKKPSNGNNGIKYAILILKSQKSKSQKSKP